jgi:hypothetical protein
MKYLNSEMEGITIDKNIPRSLLSSNGKGCYYNSIEFNHAMV